MFLPINPLYFTDYYKVHHYKMYPEGTQKVYANLTPRRSRLDGVDKVVVFGLQYFFKYYLHEIFNTYFFNRNRDVVCKEYQQFMDATLGPGAIDTKHIAAVHELGYLPLKIKALPEGSLCPIGVPVCTIVNTHPSAYWLVNYIETLMNMTLWQGMTSATIAHEYKKILLEWADRTGVSKEFVQWQGHDFSARGMSSLESAALSGSGHLLSFTGTDSIFAINFLAHYYGAHIHKELVGSSVPATEHSVMCMGGEDGEFHTLQRLLSLYPTGILSVVSDTWDLWKLITEYLPKLKDAIMMRQGKLVIRPDSGDPVDIICGYNYPVFTDFNHAEGYYRNNISSSTVLVFTTKVDRETGRYYKVKVHSGNAFIYESYEREPSEKGVVELLWEIFGGTTNDKGFRELHACIGTIYGDSITRDRANQICARLVSKGFATSNVVFGIGSYTYQYNTRDTFGFATKATYGEVLIKGSHGSILDKRELYKDPVTDSGTKKSAKGRLTVLPTTKALPNGYMHTFTAVDQVDEEIEAKGALETVYEDGKLLKEYTLDEVRKNLEYYGTTYA